MKQVILNNGVEMPAIGLGTFPMVGKTLIKTCIRATKCGYTSFDTSAAYGNEKYLAWGLILCNQRRKNVFVTTKVSNRQQRAGDIQAACKSSLRALKLKYIDLYLMHWPNPETYLETWTQMEKLYEEGLVRAIGVCNFHQHHLEKLLQIARVIPAVNQIELHPLLSQKPLVDYCRQKGIQVEAYTPLARMHEKLIKNPYLVQLAEKYHKTVCQIILRWNYQNGIIPIPKSEKLERLRENIDIFDFTLSNQEMQGIDALNEDFRVRYDPDNCDFSKL